MRKSTDPRSKCWALLMTLSMVVYFVSSNASVAGESDEIGKPLPSGAEPSSIPAGVSIPEPPQLQSLEVGLPVKRISEALSAISSDKEAVTTRGATESGVYQKAAPGVVLVVTEDGFGSGSYIGSNRIITNWHVVGESPKVTVVFFDSEQGFPATVRRIDRVRDLALLEIEFTPENLSPLKLASNGATKVGDDVHAIGHPTGYTWTYTNGFVSQVRPDFEWKIGDKTFRATVIQTQTPINPGNSGGPLLNDDAEILGTNTWIEENTEGLNFAVSVDDIRAFLDSPGQTPSTKIPDSLCVEKKLFEGRNTEDTGFLRSHDTNCDEKADLWFFVPDDRSKPIEGWRDTNSDGLIDIVIVDQGRDGKWDFSFHDTNYDGRTELTGHHPNGELEPSYYDKYAGS
jgi:S1-C subfamily serine protease